MENKKKMLIRVDVKTHQFIKQKQDEYKKQGFRISLASIVENILKEVQDKKS